MTSISYNVNTERTNVILGKHTECIWGMPYITDYIHLRNTGDFSVEDTAIAYHISPQSFYQVNPVQTEKLYSTALEYAGLTGGRIGMGSVLWDWNHFVIFVAEGKAGVRSGNCSAGDRGRKK